MTGLFITFEGIDGSGKSSQARMAYDTLCTAGHTCHLTREPGGSTGAEEIRALVLNGATDRWSAMTELLLFTAARRDHIERVIRPAIARGEIVVCDRFVDSTRAYQGLNDTDMRALVDDLHRLTIGIEADLTLLIDIDPAEGLARAKSRGTGEERFEDKGLSFQTALRSAFADIAQQAPTRVKQINGAQPMQDVHQSVMAQIQAAMDRMT